LCLGAFVAILSGLSGLGFSPAAGPKSGQFDQKKKRMNVQHRTSNIEHRMNAVYLIF